MDISPTLIKRTFGNILRRFHVIIFVTVVLGGLVVVVLLLNNIIITSGDPGDYVPANKNPSSFDQATIDRIEQLKSRTDQGAPLDLSKGRTNPFIE